MHPLKKKLNLKQTAAKIFAKKNSKHMIRALYILNTSQHAAKQTETLGGVTMRFVCLVRGSPLIHDHPIISHSLLSTQLVALWARFSHWAAHCTCWVSFNALMQDRVTVRSITSWTQNYFELFSARHWKVT